MKVFLYLPLGVLGSILSNKWNNILTRRPTIDFKMPLDRARQDLYQARNWPDLHGGAKNIFRGALVKIANLYGLENVVIP